MKIVVISAALPPRGSGQAIVMHRLFRDRDARYWFFSDDPQSFDQHPPMPKATYTKLRPLLFGVSMRNYSGPLGYLNAHLGAMRPVKIRADEILDALGGAKPDVVIGCSGSPFDLPAAGAVASELGVPFIAWLFDDPVFQFPASITRTIVRRLERDWSRKAKQIICPNEHLAKAVSARSGRVPIVIRNPYDQALALVGQLQPEMFARRPFRVIYTGAIANTQADALANLIAALQQKEGLFELHIFSRQLDRQLTDLGVTGRYVFRHEYLNDKEVVGQQQRADILFLPLAFRSPLQEAVMSASPGKMGEYLASGRPILVHAPKGSFLVDFMRAHGAAYIVDTPSSAVLSDALDEIVENADLQRSITTAARDASKLFSEEAAREAFSRLLPVG